MDLQIEIYEKLAVRNRINSNCGYTACLYSHKINDLEALSFKISIKVKILSVTN